MTIGPVEPPFRRAFDAARDPLSARNALGITSLGGGGISDAPSDGTLYGRLNGAWAAAQPYDADLAAIAGLSGVNVIYYRSAANTWSAVTVGTGLSFSGGTLSATAGAGPFQPLDGDLTALAALGGTNTIYYRSGTDTWTAVTIGSGLSFSGGTLSASAGGGDVFAAGNNTFTGQNYFNLGANLPLVVGHTARIDTSNSPLEVQRANLSLIHHTAWFNNATSSAYFNFNKSRGAAIGTHAVVQDGDTLGAFQFCGSTGSIFSTAALIQSKVDGTPGTSVPGKLEFLTRGTAGGNVVRMTIAGSGNVTLGASPSAGSNDASVATTAFVTAAVVPQVGQCRLAYESGSVIRLSPFNGNKIMISGTPRAIPDAGVTLAPTGLTAGTIYYIYAYWTGSAVALEASATGYTEVNGIKVKFGDTTRTLVGMARPNTGPIWADSVKLRVVRSWFNEAPIFTQAQYTSATTLSGLNTWYEFDNSNRAYFLAWANESWALHLNNTILPGSSAVLANAGISFDGANPLGLAYSTINGVQGYYQTMAASTVWSSLSEGLRYTTFMALMGTSGGNFTLTFANIHGFPIRPPT